MADKPGFAFSCQLHKGLHRICPAQLLRVGTQARSTWRGEAAACHHRARKHAAILSKSQRVVEPVVAGPSSNSGNGSSGGHELQPQEIDWKATGACFAFPALAGLLFGFDIGATSGVLSSLTNTATSGTDWGPGLGAFDSGLLVGMSLAGALTGSLVALLAGNRLGRRTELLAAAALYGVGAAATGGAPSLGTLLVGRALYGLGIGFAMHAAPAYISETSPPSVRGLLVSFKEAGIVGGILAGYAVSYVYADEVGGWRSIYDAAIPLAVLLGAGMAYLPESPRWLLLAGAPKAQAATALARAEGRRAADPAYVEAQVERIADSLKASTSVPTCTLVMPDDASAPAHTQQLISSKSATREYDASSQLLSSTATASPEPKDGPPAAALSSLTSSSALLSGWSRYWRPLAVGTSLMLFQQITGQPSVLYRAASILQDAGFEGGRGAAGVAVTIGLFKLLMTMVAVAKVDGWGRRPLLLSGVSGMVVALLALGAAQSEWGAQMLGSAVNAGADAPSAAAWISAGALLLYVGCYQVSFGPISWLLVGELFPLRARSEAIALATFVNFSSNFAVSLVLPAFQQQYGMSFTYFTFAAIGTGALACMAATVPETKGKSLEEIEAMWGQQQQ